ncbi:MAG TPA: transcriptional regulator, partial [Vicinamibacteria bacterium]|nr:transcriptional regulator [Vicinamibacteria bacterium]
MGPSRFGAFLFDPSRGRLTRAGEPVELPHKAAELLRLLLRNPGRVVSKAEIFDALWPDVVVQESNLTQTVYVLRKALGDAKETAAFVRTVPREGYSFVADVREDEVAPAAAHGTVPARASRWTWPALVVVGLGVAALWTARPVSPSPPGGLPDAGLRPLLTPRTAVAVVAPREPSARPQSAWLGTALAELLASELARRPQLRLV